MSIERDKILAAVIGRRIRTKRAETYLRSYVQDGRLHELEKALVVLNTELERVKSNASSNPPSL